MTRNPWPIAISLFIAALIAAVVAFAVFALRNPVELVSADYYDQEIRYQQHIDGTRRALRLEGGPVITVTGRSLVVAIPNYQSATGTVTFYRPSDVKLDRQFALALDAEGKQQVDLADLAPGPWRFRVNWVVSNETFLVEKLTIL